MKRTYCSIQEAVVWIAFRGEKLTTEEWLKRSDELEPATETLLEAIKIGAIHATGINSRSGKRTSVTIAPPSIIEYSTNSITYEDDFYYAGELGMPIFTEVEVLIENLKDGFPPKHPIKTANDEYTTPYLEIAKKIKTYEPYRRRLGIGLAQPHCQRKYHRFHDCYKHRRRTSSCVCSTDTCKPLRRSKP